MTRSLKTVVQLSCLAFAAWLAAPPVGRAAGLVLDFPLNSITGGTVTNLAGPWPGRIVGQLQTAPGRNGPALAFDGNGCVQVAVPHDLKFTQGLTLEAWIRPDRLTGGRLVDRTTPGNADSFCLDTHPGDALRFILPSGTLSAAQVLRTGEWFHVIALYDATEGFAGIYLNGKLVAQQAVAGAAVIAGTNSICLGADPQGGSRFVGKLQDVRLYDYALSDGDVAARFAGREVTPGTVKATARPICYRRGVQLDRRALLARNDVVYLSPTIYAHEAMPVGNGRLCAVVGNRGGLDLQICNANNIWFENTSGAVHLRATPGLLDRVEKFEQRQSLYDGRIETSCKTASGEWRATTTVLNGLDVIVIRFEGKLPTAALTLQVEQWRPTAIAVTNGPAAGFVEDLPTKEPRFARQMALLAQADCPSVLGPVEQKGDSRLVTLTLQPVPDANGKFRCAIYLANPVVKAEADLSAVALAKAEAQRLLAAALAQGWATNSGRAAARWHKFWEKSFLYLTSNDGVADYMENLWDLHLYWMGCGGAGDLAMKFNGGPFLVDRDARSWGMCYWWQNTRELYWPLPTANHLELCRGLRRLYLDNLAAHRKIARELFGKKGLQIEETMAPDGTGDKRGNPYTMLYLSTGLEVALQLYHEAVYARDDQALRDQILPLMKEALDFFLDYASKGPDALWHIVPCDARETYWRVADGMNEIAEIREALPILRRECPRLGIFPEMQASWQEFADHFAPLPERPGQKLYAPCLIPPVVPPSDNALINKLYPLSNTSTNFERRFNGENVELDLIFPFGQAGLGSPNLSEAVATYNHRVFAASYGWDWTPICAARLGLADEAARKVAEHARNCQHWPQGWYDSPAGPAFANGLVDCPYFDSAGVNATTTTEMVLQSYDGVIRVWPATPANWNGVYRLRAETGFMVTSERSGGTTQYVAIESLFGAVCRLANPWPEPVRVTCGGKQILRSAAEELSFPTKKGKRYLIEREAAPVVGLAFAALSPAPNTGVKYLNQTRRGQGTLTPRPGEPSLGITADGLSAPRVAAAENRTRAQAAIRAIIGDKPKVAGVKALVLDAQGQTTPAPWVTDGVYGPDTIPVKADAVGYELELPQPQQITAVVWSYDQSGGQMDIFTHLAAYRGWPTLVVLETSTDGKTWQKAGETNSGGQAVFGRAITPAQPLETRFLRLRFYTKPGEISALPCEEIAVY